MKKIRTIGQILRDARVEKGLLLRHVCAALDVDTAILSKIERNERKATKEQVVKLAEILDLDESELTIQYLSDRILDRKSTRLNSSHVKISYAVFCLKK